MDDLGGDSRDLRALGQPNPAERGIPWQEREDAVQRRGTQQTIAGTVTLVATYLLYMAGAVATNNETADTETAGLLMVLAFTTTQMVGAVLLAFGMLERHNRPYRVHLRRMVESAEEAAASAHTMTALAGPASTQLKAIHEALAGLNERIDKMPGYGQGVMDGATLREQISRGPR